MDKHIAIALIFLSMLFSAFLRSEQNSNEPERNAQTISSKHLFSQLANDYRQLPSAPFAEYDSETSAQPTLQTPSKKLPWDLQFASLRFGKIRKAETVKDSYSTTASKSLQIYIVSEGLWRGPPLTRIA